MDPSLALRVGSETALPAKVDSETVDLVDLVLVGLAKSSADGYRKDYAAFARWIRAPDSEMALRCLIALKTGQANALLLAYQSWMSAQGLSAASICRPIAALKRAVSRCRRVGLTDLAVETDLPRVVPYRDVRGPGDAGWSKMLALAVKGLEVDGGEKPGADFSLAAPGEAAPPSSSVPSVREDSRRRRDLAIVLLLHDRALRRTEAVELDVCHVDIKAPAVQVRGKGYSARVWLTINERTRDALSAWLDARGAAPGPLFQRCDRAAGDSRLDGETVNRLVKSLARRAGLERPCRAHGLRHQAVTEALDAGFDLRDVKEFSRHARIDTMLIYDDRRRDVAGDITRALGKP